MLLEKWYSDVFDGTSLQLSYRANVEFGPIKVGYVGSISDGGRASRNFVAGGVDLPAVDKEAVTWPAAGLQPELSFTGCASRPHRLWERGTRILEWNPLVLNGTVSGAGVSSAARGYVERLGVNFGPWQLGLKRLKWGRFCGQRHSLVWIEWEGRNALRLLLLDGEKHPLRRITASQVRGNATLLRLGAGKLLVQEPMGEGALRGLPLPKAVTGLSFLRGVESKWFALGELQLPGGGRDEGHAVFEEVVWP